MSRRIFEERNYCVDGRVLSLEQFRLFYDLEKGCEIHEAGPIPGYWGVDALYRITLTTKEKVQK